MTPRTPGTRTKAEIVADYRAGKLERGECRDCKRPAKIKRNGQRAKLCVECANVDSSRKAGAITSTEGTPIE